MPIEIFLFRLGCALLAGVAIGIQRELRRHQAGLTTNALVSVGACIFILISESVIMAASRGEGPVNNDNLRVLSQVVTGIGFLGAGVIMKNGTTIHGLSSAATIWCSAAVGSLCAYGLWAEALIATAVVLLINWGLKGIELHVKKRRRQNLSATAHHEQPKNPDAPEGN
ncbi:MAG: MgtC/SapB family protein [Bacteroidales bacterium]|nr:MgtC/SapB family protein [Bacteroidales bacterium]